MEGKHTAMTQQQQCSHKQKEINTIPLVWYRVTFLIFYIATWETPETLVKFNLLTPYWSFDFGHSDIGIEALQGMTLQETNQRFAESYCYYPSRCWLFFSMFLQTDNDYSVLFTNEQHTHTQTYIHNMYFQNTKRKYICTAHHSILISKRGC